jgi:flagellar protein FlaC
MLSTRPSLLLLFFTNSALIPFSKKSKDGGNQKDEGLEDIDVSIVGASVDNRGSAGQADAKRYEEMEGNINDLKDKVKSFESSAKSIKGDMEGMRGDLGKMNDTMKQLLSVYEVVSREYNPFVEPTAKRPEVPRPQAQEKKAAWAQSPNSVEVSAVDGEPYEQVIGLEEATGGFIETMTALPSKEVESNDRSRIKVATNERDVARSADRVAQDSYYLMQLLKLAEFQMEKIYIAKVNGMRIDQEDMQNLDKWFAEFKRVGLR